MGQIYAVVSEVHAYIFLECKNQKCVPAPTLSKQT